MNQDERLPNPVQWAEGMLLAPQHFQQNQIYYEMQMKTMLQSSRAYYWGLQSLEVDTGALLAGRVVLRKLQGIMPDGLALSYNAERDKALELDLTGEEESVTEVGKPIRVCIAVPVRTPGSASSRAPLRRFESVQGDAVPDENTGEDKMQVHRLRPLLKLRIVDTAQRFVQLPILELRRDADGSFKLTDYVPPLLRVTLDPWLEQESLGQQIERVLTKVRQKAIMLTGLVTSGQVRTGSVLENAHRATIERLVSQLPAVEMLLVSGAAHPFDIFLELSRLVGEVASINTNPVPDKLTRYQHDDLYPALCEAKDYIADTLELIKLNYQRFPFDYNDKGYFSLRLEGDMISDPLCLAAEVKPGRSVADLLQWLKSCRIASVSEQKKLAKERQKGAKPEFVDGFPGLEISANESRVLFTIESKTHVVPNEEFVILSMDRNKRELTPQAINLIRPNTRER